MPPGRRSSASGFFDVNTYWRKWERFTRNGINANGKWYSSSQLLQAWALILAVLYLLFFLNSSNFSLFGSGRTDVDLPIEVDTEFFRDRHLVFCISPGRAGSGYLRHVLNVAEGIISYHEPEPKMNGVILEKVIIKGQRRETLHERSALKLRAIREALEGTPPDVAYAETSHMFVKTFADVILEEIGNVAKVSIIFLRRPTKDTVWSQLRLGWFSEGHSGKDLWYYNPNDVHPSERHISYSVNASDPIDSLIGYNADVLQRGMDLEHKIRAKHKNKEWRHVRIHEVLLMDISGSQGETGVSKLLSNLGLTVDRAKLGLLSMQDTNARDTKKDRIHRGMSLRNLEIHLEAAKKQHPVLRELLY